MLQGMRFRPKGTAGGRQNSYEFLPVPATFKRISPGTPNKLLLVVVAVFVLWLFNPLAFIWRFTTAAPHYPPSHPYGSKHVVESQSRFIYPPIEDADILRKIDINSLFHEVTNPNPGVYQESKRLRSLNDLDDRDPAKQRIKEDTENAQSEEARARNFFKNQEKVVFRPKSLKNYPKVVIVTAVDYTKYEMLSLAKIVQNRVNYAHHQNYGVYVRWYQEFVPEMYSFDYLSDKERAKWVRLFCLQAAMFAFPEAQWFWYLDQDALVMNQKVDLERYLLNADTLRGAILRECSVIPPDGLIKTYKNMQPENVKLLFTQSDHKIETNSFIVKNDEIGRAAVDAWTDKLFMSYNNFPYGPDSAITHILQWHPYVLSKSAIISARTMNSFHSKKSESELSPDDHMHYHTGDLVAQWSKCTTSEDCEAALKKYSESAS